MEHWSNDEEHECCNDDKGETIQDGNYNDDTNDDNHENRESSVQDFEGDFEDDEHSDEDINSHDDHMAGHEKTTFIHADEGEKAHHLHL